MICHIIFAVVFKRMMINQRILPEKIIFVRVNWRVSMPMLFDLILVKHFRMRRDRKKRSAAALPIYMVMYKVYRHRLCRTRPLLMNRDLGLTRTLVQEMRTGAKRPFVLHALQKRLRVFVGSHIFHKCQQTSKGLSFSTPIS